MHSLVLIRHAKSSWRHEEASDLLRPLNGRGYRELQQLSRQPLLAQHLPDKVLCSPAVRTYSTALALMTTLGLDEARLQLMPSLYEADGDSLWAQLKKRVMPGKPGCCWLVAHSPGLDQLVTLLLGKECGKVATGQLTVLQSKQWSPGSYELIDAFVPKAK
ncbi:MAG: histidine phosphatase family protein [Gammaproteobacteria bacterium]|nr:histidine phosphatase family protein [Gammaproteobacteria bacterium]